MGKIIFTSNSKKLFELVLDAGEENVEAAVEAGAKLLKTYTYNKGRAMGVKRMQRAKLAAAYLLLALAAALGWLYSCLPKRGHVD